MQTIETNEPKEQKKKKPRIPPTRYLQHADLVIEGYSRSWKQTLTMIREHGFPAGALISAQVRIWSREALDRWVAEREALNLKAEVGFRVRPPRKAAKVSEPV